MTKQEKERAKAGEAASDIWPDDPAKAAQKDTDARWTVKYSKARTTKEGEKDAGLVDVPAPHFGYKNHVGIDRKWRFIRGETCTDAARYDGHELASGSGRDQQLEGRQGRYWISLCKERSLAKGAGLPLTCPPQEPHGKPMAQHIRRGTPRALQSAPVSSLCSDAKKGKWRSRSAQSSGVGAQGA